MKKLLVTIILILTVSLLLACGSDEVAEEAPTEGPPQETINVEMNDIYFGETNDNATNPPVWTVTSGAEVTATLENKGALEHNWAILKLGETLEGIPYDEATHQSLLLFEANKVPGKQTKQVSFTVSEPGEYQVICTIAGHSLLMQGKLVVR